MRKRTIGAAAAALAAGAVGLAPATSAGASTSVAVSGVFNLDWGTKTQPAAYCPGLTCGTGSLTPYGPATWTTTWSNYTDTDVVTLATSAGDLHVVAFGSNATPPGKSSYAPGGSKSYGNPFCFDDGMTVLGGTGAFTGASGTLPGVVCIAGSSVQWRGAGTISLG